MQDGEKVRMEARFTDLENQVKSLTVELEQKKKDDSMALQELDTEKKTDTEKMQMEIAQLQKQLEEQKGMQATIVQL